MGDPSGLFSTDGESLTASVTFDYEQDPARQFVITVAVTDDGSPPMEVSVYSQAQILAVGQQLWIGHFCVLTDLLAHDRFHFFPLEWVGRGNTGC